MTQSLLLPEYLSGKPFIDAIKLCAHEALRETNFSFTGSTEPAYFFPLKSDFGGPNVIGYLGVREGKPALSIRYFADTLNTDLLEKLSGIPVLHTQLDGPDNLFMCICDGNKERISKLGITPLVNLFRDNGAKIPEYSD